MWKTKADTPSLKPINFDLSITCLVDSSLDNSELSEHIADQLRQTFSGAFSVEVRRVERDAEGEISRLSFALGH